MKGKPSPWDRVCVELDIFLGGLAWFGCLGVMLYFISELLDRLRALLQ